MKVLCRKQNTKTQPQLRLEGSVDHELPTIKSEQQEKTENLEEGRRKRKSIQNKLFYEKNKEKRIQYWKIRNKRIFSTPELLERKRMRQRESYQRNKANKQKPDPIKNKARRMLKDAVRRGKIKRGPCEICGLPNSHGHHDDYSKPLSVRWLCPKHHDDLHRKLKETNP